MKCDCDFTFHIKYGEFCIFEKFAEENEFQKIDHGHNQYHVQIQHVLKYGVENMNVSQILSVVDTSSNTHSTIGNSYHIL